MNLEVSGFFAPADIYDVGKGGFTLIHRSENGFFELYRGERAGHFRVFKCLNPEFRGSLIHETMLQKEFEIGFSLRHPGIRETFAYLQIDGLGSCIEMEWIDGCTLAEYLQNGKADEAFFRQTAGSLCDAVAYLHAHQIIHRDIKPSNILITHQGHLAKLIDFSLADSDSFSLLKQPAGTRNYAAPEVIAGQPADARSDLYSLGKVLMEMTSGHRKALRRCTAAAQSGRFASAEDLKTALLRKRPVWPWLVAIAAVAVVVGFLLWGSQIKSGMTPSAVDDTASPIVPDSNQASNSAPVIAGIDRPSPAPGKAAEAVREDDVDAIFRQATELFE